MAMATSTLEVACLCLIFRLGAAGTTPSTSGLNGRKVLLVSMDGFRYDYFKKTSTPNFDAFIASGVQVPFVNATFVTNTFPSHTTIVTGLYEESHGIVGNKFYDPVYNSRFSMSSLDPKWWNGSEPIWINAVKSGLKAGTFFWPGSESPHDGLLPTQYRKYDGKIRFPDRIKTVIDWLSRDNYDFATLYFNEPDHTAHEFGPDGPHVLKAIERMDTLLGVLMNSLKEVKLKEKVDVIITSDHGMTSIDLDNQKINLYDYVNKTLVQWTIPTFGSAMNIMPQPGKAQELVDALSQVEHMHAYLKEDIPERFHYKNNRRVMPVFLYADEGWIITFSRSKYKPHLKGYHGFDNDLMTMKAIFVASGPSFKSGYDLPESINSVDIYPLLCHLLKIDPAPNNGSLARVMPLLGNPNATSGQVVDDGAIAYNLSLTLSLACFIFTWIMKST